MVPCSSFVVKGLFRAAARVLRAPEARGRASPRERNSDNVVQPGRGAGSTYRAATEHLSDDGFHLLVRAVLLEIRDGVLATAATNLLPPARVREQLHDRSGKGEGIVSGNHFAHFPVNEHLPR